MYSAALAVCKLEPIPDAYAALYLAGVLRTKGGLGGPSPTRLVANA